MAIRSREIALIKKLAVMNALNVFCWVGAPTLVSVNELGGTVFYSLKGHTPLNNWQYQKI